MSPTPTRRRAQRLMGMIAASLVPVALLATPSGAASAPTTTSVNPITLVAPSNLPGVAPLPGPTSPAFTVGSSLGSIGVSPVEGVLNTPITLSASGLAANATVTLEWSTSSATWVADVEPNTVNYLGRAATNFNVTLATVTTDAHGAFTYQFSAPADFGGLHTIYAVVNGVEVAQGGFTLLRTLTVTPRQGPVGTPITITYTGMGASFYTGGASVLYDNHYTGEMMANWTRGTASIVIRAAGAVGTHYIQVGNAISYLYLNVVQSPIPYTNGATINFRVTRDDGPPASVIDWPANVTATVDRVTTLSAAGLDPASSAVATLSTTRGPVLTKVRLSVTGLPTSGTQQLVWSTVVGNRVNCDSTCWAFSSVPLGSASATNGALNATVTVPDGLGGWHVVQVMDGTKVEAQVPFYVMESIVPFTNASGKVVSLGVASANDTTAGLPTGQAGVGTHVFKQGQEFTISIKGVGWTQLDNTLGVDYDNSYMGYGCGFNSNGYMVIHLRATGGVGTHLIDLYPMLYSLSPSFANTPYGMVPYLSYARDFPGLALGYHVPAIRLAIRVVR
ncbi:MAG: hypothetical protein KGL23_08140 [Acidobacteriota bacterium]|nr:hypothetical protein [Acidobacteriota bacterium]MDE3094039.1 hypothetical protein [Acidobacteriota bacterium]MDE3140097.1 hypothetical protein [Acidobacteriota bacterium]MDE3147386.1 hypothetical protein [Acidobacteriota bacterium]